MVISRKIIHQYRNVQVINKTNFPKKNLNSLIKLSLPEKLKHKKVIVIALNKKSYKKELKILGFAPYFISVKTYPFAGLSFYVREHMDHNWVWRPVIIVLVTKHDKKIRFLRNKLDGYLSVTTKNREELFISILSHEFNHIVCGNSSRKYGQAVEETLCDKYSIKRVKAYRKVKGK